MKVITSRSFEGSFDEVLAKRILTCLATFRMPEEAVDENLESTIERLNYYREAKPIPVLPKAPELGPFVAKLGEAKPRPDFIVVDQ